MLKQLTDIAFKFAEINITEVSFEVNWRFRDLLKQDLINQFTRYGNHLPNLDDEELEISILGVQFNITSKPKPEPIKLKLAEILSPKTKSDTYWNSLSHMINKSYSDRESQIIEAKLMGKNDLFDWASKNKSKMSTKLYNVLTNRNYFGHGAHLEDMNWEWFNKFRNCGPKRWEEFVKLRGY